MNSKPKYKRGEVVKLGASNKIGKICASKWNKDHKTWEYTISYYLGRWFEFEIIKGR